LPTGGRVAAASGVAEKCNNADGRVDVAGSVVKERISTDCRVDAAGGVVKERVITKERVVVGEVAALLTDRLRFRRKPKAAEHECDEKWQNCCVFGLSHWIHSSFFRFPRYIDSVIRGSGRGEEPSGEMSSA
jgi:hypothetical protein